MKKPFPLAGRGFFVYYTFVLFLFHQVFVDFLNDIVGHFFVYREESGVHNLIRKCSDKVCRALKAFA